MHDRTPLNAQVERALGAILARVVFSGARRVALGYSGGLDSTVLLHLLHERARDAGIELFAFHVHHGLNVRADDWLAHCEGTARALGVAFDAIRVTLPGDSGRGTEDEARRARYGALGELCRRHGIALLLTAHHLDDQAETVMLQLLRGSGVAGLRGMEPLCTAPSLLGDDRLLLGRPLLEVTRDALVREARARGLAHVEDDSNEDVRFRRNGLRHDVLPAIAAHAPGYRERLARTARHMRDAQVLLDALADQDLAACRDGDRLLLAPLRLLARERIDNVLRRWLHLAGLRMPSTSWLDELRQQAFAAREDAQLCVGHPDAALHRFRDALWIVPHAPSIDDAPPQPFSWQGEGMLAFARYGGRLLFEEAGDDEAGVDAAWLRGRALTLAPRRGGERLKLGPDRPSRSLKQHFQALAVPPWQRLRLPVVLVGREVLFAAGIGLNGQHVGAGAGPKIRLRWEDGLS